MNQTTVERENVRQIKQGLTPPGTQRFCDFGKFKLIKLENKLNRRLNWLWQFNRQNSTLRDYSRESREQERCSPEKKHNGQLQNWKSELQIAVHQQSSDWLEIIDCERMSLMPWPWSSWSRMFPSVRWSGSLKWSWGQFLINTCITTRSQPPADSLIT